MSAHGTTVITLPFLIVCGHGFRGFPRHPNPPNGFPFFEGENFLTPLHIPLPMNHNEISAQIQLARDICHKNLPTISFLSSISCGMAILLRLTRVHSSLEAVFVIP
jgi:hypothetical protein